MESIGVLDASCSSLRVPPLVEVACRTNYRMPTVQRVRLTGLISLPLCKDVYPPEETGSLCRAGQFKLVFPTSNALGKVSFFVAAKIRMPYDDRGKEQDRLIHSASQTFSGKSL